MTVMDRLVAELGGIETAIVALQEQVRINIHNTIFTYIVISQHINSDQVTRGLNCGWLPFTGENE